MENHALEENKMEFNYNISNSFTNLEKNMADYNTYTNRLAFNYKSNLAD